MTTPAPTPATSPGLPPSRPAARARRRPGSAVSVDDHIEREARAFTAEALRDLRRHLPALARKREAALAQDRPALAEGIGLLGAWLASGAVAEAADPLPDQLAEAGVAAHYVLKGMDLIPDTVPDLGLADDELIVGRILQRHPSLRKMPS